MSPRLRASIALAGVFALGIATGAGGMRFYSARRMARMIDAPSPVARHRVVMMTLDRQLDLSKDQHEKISQILSKHEPDLTAVTRAIEPRLEPIFASIEDEIRAQLTPEQRPKFDELSKKFHERRREGLPPT